MKSANNSVSTIYPRMIHSMASRPLRGFFSISNILILFIFDVSHRARSRSTMLKCDLALFSLNRGLHFLEPFVVLIPFDGSFHTLFQFYLRFKAQFLTGRGDIAAPVALFQDIVFVFIQCRHLSCHTAHVLTKERDDAQYPRGGRDAQPPGASQFLVDQVTKGSALIHLTVGEKILSASLTLL